MAIIEKGQGVNVGETEIPDNDSSAIAISSSDGSALITVDTTDGSESITIGQQTKITGPGGTTGLAASTGGNAPTLYLENSTGSSKDRTTLMMNADGNSGSNIDMYHADNLCLRIAANSTEQVITAEDNLVLKTEATDTARMTIGTSLIQAHAPLETVGAFATTGGGTVGTGGSSDATLEQTSASTFQTALHVGAAIKIVDSGDGEVFLRTVASITDANTLEMDEAAVVENGSAWYHDSGELFAVKTGDSKTLFSVNETGAIGCGSAAGTAHASNNIAIGDDDALDAITTGVSNVIVGGSNATYQLTTGSRNVIAGYRAGEDCTSTSDSVIIGEIAGAVGNMGSQQVLIGRGSGTSSTDINNVAVGYQAMYDCSGRNNVAIGHSALKATGSQDSCVALGMQALVAATGGENIGIGVDAGAAIEGGSSNICIGHQSNTGAAQTKSIAIGHQVAASVNQKAYIGDGSSATSIVFSGSGNSWSTASDSRIKENVLDNTLGLDFINALRPVKYTEINPQDWPEEIRPHIFFDKTATRTNEETGEEETYTVPANERSPTCKTVFDGLISQEVKAAADAAGTTFSGYEDSEPNGLVRLQYEKFVVPLIAAVKELSSQNETLAARIATLEAGD